jgi:hypothetical protein
MQNPAGLKLVPKRASIDDQVDRWMQESCAEFAWYIAIARYVAQKYPDLVRGELFPEHLKAAYRAEYGDNPEELSVEDPNTPDAREVARQAILEARRA